LGISQFAGLETRDTADLEVCATGGAVPKMRSSSTG